MTGDFVQYQFHILHKMTKIIGESGVGKSELVYNVEMSARPMYGIHVTCPYDTRVFGEQELQGLLQRLKEIRSKYSANISDSCKQEFREVLAAYDNLLIFCDEDTYGLGSHEFTILYQYTDAFFVICTRFALPTIPYDYRDVYRMKSSGKIHWLENRYSEQATLPQNVGSYRILVEDSNSGYEFFSSHWNCNSAQGKDKIMSCLQQGN